MSTSSVVIVGSSFSRQLFDERELFAEPMTKDYVALGDIGNFTYGSNAYTFSVVPNRIALDHNSDSVLSGELMKAAGQVVSALETKGQGHGVTGLGLNFETVLPQSSRGMSGTEFCETMCNAKQIQNSIGSPFHEILYRIVFRSGALRYSLRIEPHVSSDGANLYLSVNGHQDVATTDDLSSTLTNAGDARKYIQSVFKNVSSSFKDERT